jgi:uncharacterized protein YndB with AHSA1/START domain
MTIKDRSVVHATIVVEHRLEAPVERVFSAWADARIRAEWDLPGNDDWELTELDQDFRIGGHTRARFGPKGNAVYWSSGTYLDIVRNRRIVSAGTMHEGEKPISVTLCTIELISDSPGTMLVLTDQSAFLDGGEAPGARRSGWGEIIRRLDLYMSEPPRAY